MEEDQTANMRREDMITEDRTISDRSGQFGQTLEIPGATEALPVNGMSYAATDN
jgi:hypothetical protein